MQHVENYVSAYLRGSNSLYVNVTDLEGNYLYVNPFFVRKFGFLKDDFIGVSFAETIIANDIQKSIDASIACMEDPSLKVQVELRKPLESGGYYYTQWEFSLLVDENDVPLGILCVGYDNTPFRKQALELLTSKRNLLFFLTIQTKIILYWIEMGK